MPEFMKAPLEIIFAGSETRVVDANDSLILSVVWDDKQLGDGGVNDVLVSLVDAYNASLGEG